jgi:sugar-phosphatase
MSTPLRCTAVLFDLDGVLVHSAEPIRRSWISWAARNGLALETVEAAAHGRRAVDAIRQIAPHLDADAAAREMDAEQALDLVGVVPVPGAQALVAGLDSREWAVVTSGRRELARARLRAAGLPEPSVLVSAEDVADGKPSPEGYLLAARLLAVEPAGCVVVEDAAAGVLAARAALMHVVGLAATSDGAELGDTDAVVRSCADIFIDRTAARDVRRPGVCLWMVSS